MRNVKLQPRKNSIKNPNNKEFVNEVAFNLGIDPSKVTQKQFNNRYMPNKLKGKTVSVDYTVDGKNVLFSGNVKEGKRKAVMNVSNPEYGSRKSVEKFNKQGGLKSQKFVDKNTSGKVVQVTKNKVDRTGNIYQKQKYK
jgi:hypothetical protein